MLGGLLAYRGRPVVLWYYRPDRRPTQPAVVQPRALPGGEVFGRVDDLGLRLALQPGGVVFKSARD